LNIIESIAGRSETVVSRRQKGFFLSRQGVVGEEFLFLRCRLLLDKDPSLLDTEGCFPTSYLQRTFHDFDDRTVKFRWSICPSERPHFAVKMGIWEDGIGGENRACD
jgi:hypothetical protein